MLSAVLSDALVRFVESQCDLRGEAIRHRPAFEKSPRDRVFIIGVTGELQPEDALVPYFSP